MLESSSSEMGVLKQDDGACLLMLTVGLCYKNTDMENQDSDNGG